MNARRDPAVLLISPGILKWTDMDFGLPHLVSLGGWLREHTGVRVEILDLNYEGGDHAQLARTLDDLGPFLMVGLSAYSSMDYLRVMALARFLRTTLGPDVPLVTGGYHASALPEELVFDGSPFDVVVQGEGEKPMQRMVETLLGGGTIERGIVPHDLVMDLDTLPPYAWDLLDRYRPVAHQIGRKLQVYLSRGCAYHCTFCMERAKSGYTWRAYSPERAVDELVRLQRWMPLDDWVVNLADPLFGFKRSWRKAVLKGILDAGIVPRQFWTLTRSDDLDEEDVALLAQARFSIGIGLESGSPTMLERMQKGNTPERYLGAIQRLARLSRVHGLNWATNIIVGHPGETPETMAESHAFLTELFTSAKETCGWLSIDPFRLYPGAQVHQEMATWQAEHGTVFHHPTWWHSWYDGAFQAQHLEPSRSLDYETRVRFMVDRYGPLVGEVQQRFRGQGRSVDRVFERSLAEQRHNLSAANRDRLLAFGRTAKQAPTRADAPVLSMPIGLHLKDPWVRRREEAVRRLLDHGVLRTAALVEAMLRVPIERFAPAEAVKACLADRPVAPEVDGLPAVLLPIREIAMGLEALEPALGDHVCDLTAVGGYVTALLAELVGPEGRAVAVHPAGRAAAVGRSLVAWPQAIVRDVPPAALGQPLAGPWDGVWIGAALPRMPAAVAASLRDPDGRCVTAVGPRFRAQDLASFTRRGRRTEERRAARVRWPVLGGRHGWLRTPPALPSPTSLTRVVQPEGPARLFEVLAHVDAGRDAAGLFDPRRPRPPWAPVVTAAWHAAPNRVALQAVGLVQDDVAGLVARLRGPRPLGTDDPADAMLAQAVAIAIEQVDTPAPLPVEDADAVRRRAAELLDPIRRHLWATRGAEPPPLELVHVPALGPRGRAIALRDRRRVATDLTREGGHVAMQALHEEVHPFTDPVIRARFPEAVTRDTRAGTDGRALHDALEQAAIDATGALVQQLAPAWQPTFDAWVAGLGQPVAA